MLVLDGHHGARESLLVSGHQVVSREILVHDGLVVVVVSSYVGRAGYGLRESDLVAGLALCLLGRMRGGLLVLAQVLADGGALVRGRLLVVIEVNDYLTTLVVVDSVLLNDNTILSGAILAGG